MDLFLITQDNYKPIIRLEVRVRDTETKRFGRRYWF